MIMIINGTATVIALKPYDTPIKDIIIQKSKTKVFATPSTTDLILKTFFEKTLLGIYYHK